MSQLFDSLRRGQQRIAAPDRRTAQGDAVLASLGYAPVRRARIPPFVLGVALVGLPLFAWWRLSPELARETTSAAASTIPPAPAAAVSNVPPPGSISSPDAPPAAPAPSPAPLVSQPSHEAAPLTVAAPPQSASGLSVTPTPRLRDVAATSPGTAPPAPIPAAAPAAVPVRADGRDEAELMRLALYYHRAGDFENALLRYRAVLQQNELNAPAHNNLGMLYQEKNLLDEAAREFQRALLIDPGYVLAHNNYGVTLLRQGNVAAAASQFRAVSALEPANVDAVVNLALSQKALNQTDLARGTLLRAIGMSPTHPAAHYNLAVIYDETGEVARAIDHYRTFLDTAGSDHAARAPQVRARLDALSKR